MDIPVKYPLDTDGFLRRECPNCAREFKWYHGTLDSRPSDAIDPPKYSCPLCGNHADHDQWFTQDQVRHQREVIEFYKMDVVNDEMKRMFGKNYKPGRSNAPVPTPLVEPDDMIIIEPPCHPWEPVKVPEERADSGPLFCLVCGESYSA
ncbi:hypothetical protein [Mycobacteroides abscessus]